MEKFIGINLIILCYLYCKKKNPKKNSSNKYRNIDSLKTRHHY